MPDSPYKTKAAAIRAVMRNKELSNSLFDAWESHHGSTKRKTASNVLKAVHRAHLNFAGARQIPTITQDTKSVAGAGSQDGQGGGEADAVRMGAESAVNAFGSAVSSMAAPMYKYIDQFMARQGSAVNPPQTRAGQYAQQIGAAAKPAVDWTKNVAGNVGRNVAAGVVDVLQSPMTGVGYLMGNPTTNKPAWGESYRPIDVSGLYGWRGQDTAKAPPRNEKERIEQQWREAMAKAAARNNPNQNVGANIPGDAPPPAPDAPPGTVYGPWTSDDATQYARDLLAKGMTPEEALAETKRVTRWDVYLPEAHDAGGADNIDTSAVQSILNNYGEDTLDAWYAGLDGSAKDYYKEIYEAVKSGVGAQVWTMQVMNDRKLMAKLLKVPEDQIASLPHGLLSEQLNDLKDATKKEYQLDDIMNRLVEAETAGANIQDDLQSYIRGKDEYLGTIERMQDEADERIAQMDTSNPYVARRMQNYKNYLTILQGRQNQRYIGYLNSSVAQHNAEIAQLSTLYERQYNKANEEFQSKAAISKEEYDNMKASISSMYTNLAEREKLHDENMKKQLDLYGAQLDNAGKVLENQKKYLELQLVGKDVKPNYKFDEVQKWFMDDDGNLIEFNPEVVRERAVSYGSTNPEQAITDFVQATQRSMETSASSGSFLAPITRYASTFNNDVRKGAGVAPALSSEQIAALSTEQKQLYLDMLQREADIENMTTAISSSVYRGLENYLKDKGDEIRSLIKSLGSSSWFGLGAPTSKESFLKQADGAGISHDVASSMYDQYHSSEDNAESYRSIINEPDNRLSSDVASSLAGWVTQALQ